MRHVVPALALLLLALPSFAAGDGVTRRLGPGEGLSEVARRYGVSERDLREANPALAEPLEGLEVRVPPPPRGWPRHEVARGDTLWSISKRYEVPLDELREANALSGDTLRAGQVLVIPRAELPALPPPNWLAVTLPDGRKGWVPGSAVLLPSATPQPPEEILALAFRLKGTPYEWGGEDPDGVDCSGFVQEVYRMGGYRLPRLADEQFTATAATDRQALQPGDLVFFTTYLPGPSHVGIYLGEGRFLHASSSRGVTEDRLDSEYFGPRFLGGRRLKEWVETPATAATPGAAPTPVP